VDGAIIETGGLVKAFGARRAIDGVSLEVPAGVCFGFLGPNGAGKTTLIRMLLGLARPTAGWARVRGHAVPDEAPAALARVGGIVEEARFYPYLTGRQNLRAQAALLDPGAAARIPATLDRVGLAGRADERVGRYSMGMRQRLGVARALLADPELLVLDEPTNGLDPAGIAEFREMIRGMVEQEGRTVFLSSHLLDEVQRTCDHVAIVDHGRVIVQGSVRELIRSGETGMAVDADDPARARRILAALPGVRGVRERADGTLLALMSDPGREAGLAISRALAAAGVGLASLARSEESLEERFLDLTRGSTPSGPGAPPPPPPPPPS
jgi:ABC-2 type transport system ATP-binding protein